MGGTFHTPWYENIEDFRLKRERRTRTNSLTGKIEIEEEDKEIYNSKRKILSSASEEREKKRTDCRTDTMQYQQTPLSRSTLTKRTPPEQNNTDIRDKYMEDEETGKTEEVINRKDWDALVSLVRTVAKDLSELKLMNESIRTEQINIRKEQTETRKEIEELKLQTEKNAREVEERYINLGEKKREEKEEN